MPKILYVAVLCAATPMQCGHPGPAQCRTLGAFPTSALAEDYQQYYCREWHLPACDQQPPPEAVPWVTRPEVDENGFELGAPLPDQGWALD